MFRVFDNQEMISTCLKARRCVGSIIQDKNLVGCHDFDTIRIVTKN
jgi:hypothetical protein